MVGVKVSERWCGLLMEEAVVGPDQMPDILYNIYTLDSTGHVQDI